MAADPLPATPGPRPGPPPAGAVAVGAHLGATIWWCEELFALIGGWVPTTEEAPARIHLAELSRMFGEVAASLAPHLPRPSPVDPRAWVAPPAPDAAAVMDLLDGPATLERLAGIHRVLVPRLVVSWAGLARASVENIGRGLQREIRHTTSDLGGLGLEGEALLQAHVAAVAEGARRAAAHVGAVEAALVALGGLVPVEPVWPATGG